MTERTIKIKELIHNEVCMGTYGLVELELIEIEKEIETLKKLINSSYVCYAPDRVERPCRHSFGIICQYNSHCNFKQSVPN